MLHISTAASAEVVIKKSRFIGHAIPVDADAQAKQLLAELRRQHPKASHCCYGMIIDAQTRRSSDDGEPSGTAGAPIMAVIAQRQVEGCLVAVIRYFGGTLLGTGGLVRAYQQAAGAALDAAVLTRPVAMQEFEVRFPYELLGRVEHLLAPYQVTAKDCDGPEAVYRYLSQDDLTAALAAISAGTVRPKIIGRRIIEVPLDDGRGIHPVSS